MLSKWVLTVSEINDDEGLYLYYGNFLFSFALYFPGPTFEN
jgi:hypothetical protein